jgi:predicted acylesterase/phospholipase RssA
MKLRIGLIISGAVSLGAYEGGALAALLIAVQDLRDDVVIDVISGASAGAMTGLLAARCLTLGADPLASMRQAWVDLPDLQHLQTHELTSPLSSRVLAAGASKILGPTGPAPDLSKRQDDDVVLSMSIVDLGGLGYLIQDLQATSPVPALTYLDWYDATFTVDSTTADYASVASAALASGANAAGFPPKLVHRTTKQLDAMRASGLQNVPTGGSTWYTDGGTIDNEPFGRMLDLLGTQDDPQANEDARLLVMVDPIPTEVPGDSQWTDITRQPRWSTTARRAFALQSDQRVFDDLEALTKVNTRLAWVERVVEAVSAAATNTTAVEPLRKALNNVIVELDDDHRELNSRIGRTPSKRAEVDTDDLADLVRAAIHRAAGLSGKKAALVEIVSPRLDASGKSPSELLAGDHLGHFFGFVDVRFRQSDFALGFSHMTAWVREHLPVAAVKAGLAELKTTAAADHLDQELTTLGWEPGKYGHANFHTLSFGEKARLLGLGAHVAYLVQDDLRHPDEGLTARDGADFDVGPPS